MIDHFTAFLYKSTRLNDIYSRVVLSGFHTGFQYYCVVIFRWFEEYNWQKDSRWQTNYVMVPNEATLNYNEIVNKITCYQLGIEP